MIALFLLLKFKCESFQAGLSLNMLHSKKIQFNNETLGIITFVKTRDNIEDNYDSNMEKELNLNTNERINDKNSNFEIYKKSALHGHHLYDHSIKHDYKIAKNTHKNLDKSLHVDNPPLFYIKQNNEYLNYIKTEKQNKNNLTFGAKKTPFHFREGIIGTQIVYKNLCLTSSKDSIYLKECCDENEFCSIFQSYKIIYIGDADDYIADNERFYEKGRDDMHKNLHVGDDAAVSHNKKRIFIDDDSEENHLHNVEENILNENTKNNTHDTKYNTLHDNIHHVKDHIVNDKIHNSDKNILHENIHNIKDHIVHDNIHNINENILHDNIFVVNEDKKKLKDIDLEDEEVYRREHHKPKIKKIGEEEEFENFRKKDIVDTEFIKDTIKKEIDDENYDKGKVVDEGTHIREINYKNRIRELDEKKPSIELEDKFYTKEKDVKNKARINKDIFDDSDIKNEDYKVNHMQKPHHKRNNEIFDKEIVPEKRESRDKNDTKEIKNKDIKDFESDDDLVKHKNSINSNNLKNSLRHNNSHGEEDKEKEEFNQKNEDEYVFRDSFGGVHIPRHNSEHGFEDNDRQRHGKIQKHPTRSVEDEEEEVGFKETELDLNDFLEGYKERII